MLFVPVWLCRHVKIYIHRPFAPLIRGTKLAEKKYIFFSAERAEKKKIYALKIRKTVYIICSNKILVLP